MGTNHKHAPVAIREGLWCSTEKLPARLKATLRETPSLKEVVILSTCNRTEIYAVSPKSKSVHDYLVNTLSEWGGLQVADLEHHLYSLRGEVAVQHLIEVATGLDSLVIGEQQIHSQVRDAINLATQAGTVKRFSSELFHHAYRAATEIRRQSGIEAEGRSVSSAAISLLQDLAQKRPIKTILLVGAGKMISLAAKDLSQFSESEIWVANRTIERAKELACRLGGKPIGFDKIVFALQQADVVLTCTSASDYIIKRQDVKEAMSKRAGAPLILIDTAVPRNIDPTSEQIPDVQLYNIDSLSPFVNGTQESYQPKIDKAEELARREAENFYAQLRADQAADTLRDLRKLADDIREEELRRALRKLENVSDREKEIVDLLTRRIVNKLLYEPTARLKEHASNGDSKTYETVLRELFAIDRETKK